MILMNDMIVRNFNCVEKRQADQSLLEAGLTVFFARGNVEEGHEIRPRTKEGCSE